MSGSLFDAFTRHAADAVSRRTSLLALAGAAAPAVTSAGKTGKKARRKCKKQGTQCRNLLSMNVPAARGRS